MGSLATASHARFTNRYNAVDGWKRTGIIVSRTWPPGFTEDEYITMQAGGRRRLHDSRQFTHPTWLSTQIQRDLDRHCLDRFETQNTACNAGRTVVLDFLGGIGSPTGLSYFAVGNGASVAPAAADTQLVSEQFRKTFATTTISGNSVLTATFFATTDANFAYTEAGLFGNGASGTANSGTLFAHAIYTYSKNSSIALTNDYSIYQT